MHRLLILFACLSAAPVVAQWTVTRFAGIPSTPVPPVPSDAAQVSLALNPGSSVFVTNGTRIWRVRSGGVFEQFAGTDDVGFAGDGGPATAAQLNGARDPQADAAGNVYFFDEGNRRIRRVAPNGIITTVAGYGIALQPGMDVEGPGTSRALGGVIGSLVVRSSGDLYFADSSGSGSFLIRRLTTAGRLELLAGALDNCGSCTDGDIVPALAAHMAPLSLTFDPAGNIYFKEGDPAFGRIRRLSPDGFVTRVAGFCAPCFPFATADQPALVWRFNLIRAVAADAFGNVFLNHTTLFDPFPFIVSRIDPAGFVHTIPGATALYTDAAGRIVYRVGNLLYDAQNDSVIGDFPALLVPPPAPPFVAPPDGTVAQDVPLVALFGAAVSRAGELHYPEGCRIRKFDRSGILRTVTSLCESVSPSVRVAVLVFDSQDHLWFSTVPDNRVFRVLPDGQVVEHVLSPNFGGSPYIALDAKDRLYTMGVHSYVQRIETDGTVRFISPPPPENILFDPRAIGNDPQGNFYFAGGFRIASGLTGSGVYRVNDDGSSTKVSEQFPSPGEVLFSVDVTGRLWAGPDFTSPAGTFHAGLRGGYGGDGGPVQSARFGSSLHSVLAPDGTLYVSDSGRIRKLSPIGQAPSPVISTGGVVNAASYTGGPIAPGELISIFGFSFGPASGSVEVGQALNNILQSAVGRTKVLFGSLEGKITAVTPNQINVFVPHSVLPSGSTTAVVDVVVLVDDAPSLPMQVPVVERAFDLFAMDASGSGQGAILNQDQSLNGSSHPALRGTIVSLWGTGEGLLSPALPDGALVISTPYPKPSVNVTVKIGGVDAEVLYAGAAPTLPTGAFQINARIPLTIPPGNASVSVTVGSSTTTRNITVAVQ